MAFGLGADGVAQCGIERAYRAGAANFQKPISCHLYPVRVHRNPETGFEALNYHEWEICSAACQRGQAERIALYRFVREALVRLDVPYPVAIDNDRRTWRAYNNRYWPTLYLIDKRGDIRYVQIGEGNYARTELVIQALLAEPG